MLAVHEIFCCVFCNSISLNPHKNLCSYIVTFFFFFLTEEENSIAILRHIKVTSLMVLGPERPDFKCLALVLTSFVILGKLL